MKKLLSLLSVLTITGTPVPSVIAASAYQKQETIDNLNNNNNNNLQLILKIVEIKHINDDSGAVFVRTAAGDAYYLNNNGLWKYNVPYPVTSIYRFDKTGYNRNAGDVYLGTTNVLYLVKMYSWTAEYIVDERYLLDNDIIKINSLNNVDNNTNIAILNELNYLNPTLDISQLEVINKTSTSAIIKAKNNSSKYIGEKKVYYEIDNQQNKIINLDELIKKGIFLSFRDKNQGIIKDIKNINTNNLIYSNVTATKVWSYKENKGFIKIRKKIPLIYLTK